MFESVIHENKVVMSFPVDLDNSQALSEIGEFLDEVQFSVFGINHFEDLSLGGFFGVVDEEYILLASQLVESLELEAIVKEI